MLPQGQRQIRRYKLYSRSQICLIPYGPRKSYDGYGYVEFLFLCSLSKRPSQAAISFILLREYLRLHFPIVAHATLSAAPREGLRLHPWWPTSTPTAPSISRHPVYKPPGKRWLRISRAWPRFFFPKRKYFAQLTSTVAHAYDVHEIPSTCGKENDKYRPQADHFLQRYFFVCSEPADR